MRRKFILLLILWLIPSPVFAQPVDLEEQVRRIATELRCPVCQNLSVADSPSEMAQQMRAIIQEQLQEGKSPQEVKAYFISKYGEWVMLAPTAKGFSLLIWILPYVALAGGIVFAIFMARRWARNRPMRQPTETDSETAQIIKRDMAHEENWEVDPELQGPQVPLLLERARLYGEIQELDLDYQAGKLSLEDYREARQGYEQQAAQVLKELAKMGPVTAKPSVPTKAADPSTPPRKRPVWVFATTGAFLLLFGVTLGILLSQSVRPRTSAEDSITGDFLTGTTTQVTAAQSKDMDALLQQGRDAYAKQNWSQSIDAFKRALAIDPRNPEAHSYMGLILAGAGHSDSALMAFERALSVDPNYALALWGNGMVLYRQKNDLEGARKNFKSLLPLLPPGAERQSVLQTLEEINGQRTAQAEGTAPVATDSLQGTISMDSKLKAKYQGGGILFIIARRAGGQGGPPLAVKRIPNPVFPLSYSLGKENMMIPGSAFEGKLNLVVRLDKDGDPLTRGAGDFTGSYPKNPVAIGSQNVDVVLNEETK
ncbi:MAG: tetratricopeptide repeat protein [Deltaproteobacteria bacterium]|nr:tetratricopeptide repeat protein [Deltaproteobacteria bacterium]